MILAAAMSGALLAGQVELRGGEVREVEVVRVDERGVRVRSSMETDDAGGDAPGVTRTISWHRVKRVMGPRAEDARAYAAIAEDAWRASERLRRGDAPLAEPLFERLDEVYAGVEGPTASVVSEGLLLCRLDRGAWEQAIGPWLDVAASVRADEELAEPPFGRRPIDEATLLARDLPPMWVDPALTEAVESAANRRLGAGDEVVAALAAWTAAAARFERTGDASLPEMSGDASEHPGVRLMRLVVSARAGDAPRRSAARSDLARLAQRRTGEWVEAWARAGVGRSLLLEESEEARLDGVLELLHLPARFGDSQPYLAGLALAEAAAELHEQGRGDEARRLRGRLLRHFPGHSAIEWLRPRLERRSDEGEDAS